MEWSELFSGDHQPASTDMEEYIGGEGKRLWNELFDYMAKAYGVKPKMSYSKCSGKLGWNVKFQKSGVSFGTLYPEENGFSVFMVIGYKLGLAMEAVRGKLSQGMRERIDSAQDYMKMGRWIMFRIESKSDLEDYKLLTAVKATAK